MSEHLQDFQAMDIAVEAALSGGYPSSLVDNTFPFDPPTIKFDYGPGANDYVKHEYSQINYSYGSPYGIGTIPFYNFSIGSECSDYGQGSNDTCSVELIWLAQQSNANPTIPSEVRFWIECNDTRLQTGNENDFSFTANLYADWDVIFNVNGTNMVFRTTSSPNTGYFDYIARKYVGGSFNDICGSQRIYVFGGPVMQYSVSMNPAQACQFLANMLNGNQPFGFYDHAIGSALPNPSAVPNWSGVQSYLVDPDAKSYWLRQTFFTTQYYPLGDDNSDACAAKTWTNRTLDSSILGAAGQFTGTLRSNVSLAP